VREGKEEEEEESPVDMESEEGVRRIRFCGELLRHLCDVTSEKDPHRGRYH
jgi:hypothetical protein